LCELNNEFYIRNNFLLFDQNKTKICPKISVSVLKFIIYIQLKHMKFIERISLTMIYLIWLNSLEHIIDLNFKFKKQSLITNPYKR
jgi:hypothetical protein